MLSVVLIDDEYYMRKALAISTPWEELGYQLVGEAEHGLEGLQLIRDLKPDLALVDINMPQMDGISLIEEVKKEGLHTKCIILTGYGEFTYAQNALRLGVLNYILKPVIQGELIKALGEVYTVIHDEKQTKIQENLATISKDSKSHKDPIIKDLQKYLGSEKDLYLYSLQLIKGMDEEELGRVLLDILEELNIREGAYSWQGNRQIYNLLINKANKGEVEERLLQLKGSYKQQDIVLFICGGDTLTDMNHLAHSYQDNAVLLSSRLVLIEKGIMRQDDLNHERIYGQRILDPRCEDELFCSLRKKDSKAVEKILIASFIEAKEKQYPIGIIQSVVNKIVDVVCGYLQECEALDDHVEQRIQPFYHIDEWAVSCEEIRGQLVDLCTYTMSLEVTELSEVDLLVQDIKDYVLSHYHHQECNINKVVENFNFNYHYICKLFKSKTGVSLGEFIIQTRMIQAKELIDGGLDQVEKLADSCGYSDGRYFSKSFKKHFGITPSSYIKRSRGRMKSGLHLK